MNKAKMNMSSEELLFVLFYCIKINFLKEVHRNKSTSY